MIRETMRAAEQLRLRVCDLLAEVHAVEEWTALGLDSFTDYADACGLSQSQASKMLKIGRLFPPGVRNAFPPDQIDGLSIERLYVAAQMLERGVVENAEEALRAAIVHPAEQLVGMRDGHEPQDRKSITCPDCGQEVWHTCHAEKNPI